jgi:hypothetical protein
MVVDYLSQLNDFLKFTTSVAHYIVDDDSDHVLMRMTLTIQAPGQAQVEQDDRELASGLY